MRRKTIYLMVLIVLMGMAGSTRATDIIWRGGPTAMWDGAGNSIFSWMPNQIPTSVDVAWIKADLNWDPIIDAIAATALTVRDDAANISITVRNNGTLTCQNLWIGDKDCGLTTLIEEQDPVTFNLESGTVTVGGSLQFGYQGYGILHMDGGIFDFNCYFDIGNALGICSAC